MNDAMKALEEMASRLNAIDGMHDWSVEAASIRAALEAKAEPVGHADYGYIPACEYPWFFYDSDGDGMVFCKTEQEAKAGAERAIDDSLDELWSESVDQICYGRVIMVATQCDREERPDSIDDDGISDDGDYWPEHCEFKCNYRLDPIEPAPPSTAEVRAQALDGLIARLRSDVEKHPADAGAALSAIAVLEREIKRIREEG